MTKLQQLSLALISASFGLEMVFVRAVQAASFTFDFVGQGQGSLQFENTTATGITGVGDESIELSKLQTLAEDVNFQFSFPTFGGSGPGEVGDTDYGNYFFDPVFKFSSGRLSGIDFESIFGADVTTGGGGGFYSQRRLQTLFVKDNRFKELVNLDTESGYPLSCESTGYYDPQTGRSYDAIACRYNNFKLNQKYTREDNGFRYTRTTLSSLTTIYYVPELQGEFTEVSENPTEENLFIPFNTLPQITFTTVEPIVST